MSFQRSLRRQRQVGHIKPINVSVINLDGSISVIPHEEYSKLMEGSNGDIVSEPEE